jgi:hypothetical protein
MLGLPNYLQRHGKDYLECPQRMQSHSLSKTLTPKVIFNQNGMGNENVARVWPMKIFFWALLLTPLLASADFSIEGPVTHLELFRTVEKDLPTEIKATINRKVTVAFRNLSTNERRILGRVVTTPLFKHTASHVDLDQSLASPSGSRAARRNWISLPAMWLRAPKASPRCNLGTCYSDIR